MERIGIYGGSFNPPHIGHIRAAKCALETLKLSKLLLIPAGIAPHKVLPKGSASALQRMEMVRLAVAEEEGIETSDIEIVREGISYTYETVAQLRSIYPQAELVLLMGTDMFLSFLSWKRPQDILDQVTLGVFYRGEREEISAIEDQKGQLEKMGARVVLVKNPVTAISSTQLRRLLRFRCAQPFLPAGVDAYIQEKGLYGVGECLKNLSLKSLEQTVVTLLKSDRVAHVLGCRDTAVEMARRWGVDETAAARAALLHDVTKALDGSLQLTLCQQYDIILDDFSTQNPKTLHALTGSLVAERIFGESTAVVSAIRSHTTGKAGMNTLEKIIYVADYIEPNRDFPGVEQLRKLAYTNLDKALKLGLEMTLDVLRKQGRQISPESIQALAYLHTTDA